LRTLYVDINASFHNPTRNLVPLALMRATDTSLFGPGHVDARTLRRGLHAYVEAAGPFDICVSNTHVLYADIYDAAPDPAQFRKFYDLGFDAADVLQLPGLAAEFERLTIPRAAIFLESDYYNWTEREINAIERRTDYTIAFGPEFSRLRNEMTDLQHEAFAPSVTDAWASYARRNPTRIASFLHFVSDTEISLRRLARRSKPWSVIGVQYHARKVALDLLRKEGIAVLRQTPVRRLMGLAKRLRLISSETRLQQRLLNLDYQHRLEQSRYAYACGSALDMPVRKFFEIPAAGAVLVCKPFCGFEAAGFRDGVNAIVCPPENVLDVHRMLEADMDRAQGIADAGRQLVFAKHSLAARAEQLRATLAAMADRSFAGGRWSGGEYRVARKTA
jgi:hypothetical protein